VLKTPNLIYFIKIVENSSDINGLTMVEAKMLPGYRAAADPLSENENPPMFGGFGVICL